MGEALHSNLSILAKLDIEKLDECRDIFSDDFVWHFFNRRLTELDGDYFGVEGLKSFFKKLGEISHNSFKMELVNSFSLGNELVVNHVCDQMYLNGNNIELDAVIVWRIVDQKIKEAWDIPAVNTVRLSAESS